MKRAAYASHAELPGGSDAEKAALKLAPGLAISRSNKRAAPQKVVAAEELDSTALWWGLAVAVGLCLLACVCIALCCGQTSYIQSRRKNYKQIVATANKAVGASLDTAQARAYHATQAQRRQFFRNN